MLTINNIVGLTEGHTMYKPYVYFLENKTTGMKYIGAKYAKNSDERILYHSFMQ